MTELTDTEPLEEDFFDEESAPGADPARPETESRPAAPPPPSAATRAPRIPVSDLTPLAWDLSGNRIRIPSEATGWRVRRLPREGRGRPQAVYTDDGLPLRLPIHATLDTLADAVEQPGKYRLSAIDDEGFLIASCPAAFACVPGDGEEEEPPARSKDVSDGALRDMETALCEMAKQCSGAVSTLCRIAERAKAPPLPEPSAPPAQALAPIEVALPPAPSEPEKRPSSIEKIIDALGGPDVLRAVVPLLLAKLGPLATFGVPKTPGASPVVEDGGAE